MVGYGNVFLCGNMDEGGGSQRRMQTEIEKLSLSSLLWVDILANFVHVQQLIPQQVQGCSEVRG